MTADERREARRAAYARNERLLAIAEQRLARQARRGWLPPLLTERQRDGIAVLIVLWLVFATGGLVVGLLASDVGAGVRGGTLVYGLLIGSATIYGWYSRRSS